MINRMKIKKQKLLKRVNCKKMEKELEDMITGCRKERKILIFLIVLIKENKK
jgi:hypothetical protein